MGNSGLKENDLSCHYATKSLRNYMENEST